MIESMTKTTEQSRFDGFHSQSEIYRAYKWEKEIELELERLRKSDKFQFIKGNDGIIICKLKNQIIESGDMLCCCFARKYGDI